MPSPVEDPHPPDDRRARFEDIYASNRARILGYALRRTADPQDAADVLAETFLTAWRRLDDVPPDGQARLWLYGVARRVLANHHRGERRRTTLAADLADRITATDFVRSAEEPRRSLRVVIGLPLAAAGVTCAAVTVAVVAQEDRPGLRPAPSTAEPTRSPNIRLASALTFKRQGDFINVRVRDPLADPERYKAEFAAHGLNVELTFVPASPSIVGTVVMMETEGDSAEGDITTITAKGECETGGGGDACPVGVRVRTTYEGRTMIAFGRAARPGERYTSTAPVTAPGEIMHGMTFRGHRVSDVLAALEKRKVTVPEFRYEDANQSTDIPADQVQPTWYVRDATPLAKGQVLLFVGAEPPPPPPRNGAPGAP
ncbi:RNA polymerase sigma factor [Actinomadura sp. 9N407]|uniref:RNA polymerase sigma factor n=1 Tax=Actinomadura sp. 9N407 TaxID=3375154 RepID=UPI0037A68558